jgi:ferrous-iron efflux pump FieF
MNIANPYLSEGAPEDLRNRALKRWATIASLSVAVILMTMKFFAFLVTDSVSMLSSVMDSAFDGIASLATLISVSQAASPADEDHRFGYGKLEALTALAQALFICGSGLFLLFESVHRFLKPVHVQDAETGVYVMAFSILLTGALIAFQHYVIRKTKSVAISADHMHYRGDLFLNFGVCTALVLGYYSRWPYFDPLFSAVTAIVLLWGTRAITRDAFGILMDRELSAADREKIMTLARSHRSVRAVHDLRTRSTGLRVFIEFHMEIDGDMRLKDAHDVTEEVEKLLFEAFPTAEVIIHQEPFGIDDHRIDAVVAR